MGRTVNTIFLDDLDDTEIDGTHATTVTWSWRGVSYEFDTSTEHLAALEVGAEAVTVAHLLDVSRRVAGRRHGIRPAGARDVSDAARIRAWARENGIMVPDRGRIPGPIRDSYASARDRMP